MKKLMVLSAFLALSGCYAHHERCVAQPEIDFGAGPSPIACSHSECEIYPGCILELDESGLLPGACMLGENELSWDAAPRIGDGACSAIEAPTRLYQYFGTSASGVVDSRESSFVMVLGGL